MSKQPFDDFTGGVVTPRGTVYFEDGVLIIPKQKNKKTPAVSGNHGKELDMRDLTVEERLELGNSWDNFYYCFKKRFFVVFDNNEYHIKVTAKDIINYPSSRTLVDRKVKTLEELKTVIEEAVDMTEKKYTGYGYHGGGRKKQGTEAKRTTVSFVCTPSEKTRLKELAENAGLSQSQFICRKIFS